MFVQVLKLCERAGLVKLGHVAIDGSKLRANASKHKAMSYERMCEKEQQLTAEVARLLGEAVDYGRQAQLSVEKLRLGAPPKDPEGEPVASGGRDKYEPDSDLRDFENVPRKEHIVDYFLREVRPYVADGWIDLPILDEMGFPRTTRGVSEVPGLTFIGSLWQFNLASGNLIGVALDALHLAEQW